jgi:hypothetical protein
MTPLQSFHRLHLIAFEINETTFNVKRQTFKTTMEIFFCNFIEINFGSLITKLNESCTYISNLLVDILLVFQKQF